MRSPPPRPSANAFGAGLTAASAEAMKPRLLLPARCYLVTRRCSQRLLFLAPSKEVRRAFRYCLGVAAKKYEVAIHAYVVMGNHFHLVCTDPSDRLPKLMHWLNLQLAKVLNTKHERGENLWAPGSYNMVHLATLEEVREKVAYVITNPVAARLVCWVHEYPGDVTLPRRLARTVWTAQRPTRYFAKRSKLPKRVTLELTKPACFAHVSDESYRAQIEAAVKHHVDQIHHELTERGEFQFRGPRAVAAQADAPLESAGPTRPDRGLTPRLAGRNRARRIEELTALKTFDVAYRAARERWCQGDRDVEFPPGTYWLRVFHGARTAAA